jgi:hypothetical protein
VLDASRSVSGKLTIPLSDVAAIALQGPSQRRKSARAEKIGEKAASGVGVALCARKAVSSPGGGVGFRASERMDFGE